MNVQGKEDVVLDFVQARDALYEHLGFKEDWTMYPINTETLDYRWCKLPEGKIRWQDDDLAERNDYCEADIFCHRFYPKGSVFEGKDYTMIFGSPHVDGMVWAYIFKNSLRVPAIPADKEQGDNL